MSRIQSPVSVAAGLLLAAVTVTLAQEAVRPLPDQEPFLLEVRKHLTGDRLRQSQYTYRETRTSLPTKKGARTRVRVYEVYPSVDQERAYRRLIAVDGVPVEKRDLDKKDAEHRREVLERIRKIEREGTSAKEKRRQREAGERREEQQQIDEAFRLYDIRMIGRRDIDRLSAIGFTFTPRAGFRSKTDSGKIMKKFKGEAWFNEADYEMVSLHVEAIDTLSFGLGVFARVHKGTQATFSRRKVNNEVWLPAELRVTGSARMLLFKKLNVHTVSEFSDYRKFNVETSEEYLIKK